MVSDSPAPQCSKTSNQDWGIKDRVRVRRASVHRSYTDRPKDKLKKRSGGLFGISQLETSQMLWTELWSVRPNLNCKPIEDNAPSNPTYPATIKHSKNLAPLNVVVLV